MSVLITFVNIIVTTYKDIESTVCTRAVIIANLELDIVIMFICRRRSIQWRCNHSGISCDVDVEFRSLPESAYLNYLSNT